MNLSLAGTAQQYGQGYGLQAFGLKVLAFAAMFICVIAQASAHEIRPAIADVTIESNRFEATIALNAEGYVAGIDLGAILDTNEAENAERYDILRALEPPALEEAFRAYWPTMRDALTLRAGENAVIPELINVEAGPVGNIELARDTTITFTATLPNDGTDVTFGWPASFGALVVRQGEDGAENSYTGYLIDGNLTQPMPRTGIAEQTSLQAFANYIVIGFEHIIPKGLDHILFVLGLFFFSSKFRPLVFQITAFTLAHTVTLALATLGIVSVPASIVEPLIAASIVWIAVENILAKGHSRWRLPVVFGFGLLHGLGFASVLGDIGLQAGQFISGLIAFNIGVELGQLSVIAIAFFGVGLWFSKKDWYRPFIAVPVSVLIGLVGAWWFYERVFS